jgi:hypothetical protein
MEALGVDVRIISERILEKLGGKLWIGFIWLRNRGQCRLWTRQWTFGFHKMRGISWLAERLLASREGLRSMELVLYRTTRGSLRWSVIRGWVLTATRDVCSFVTNCRRKYRFLVVIFDNVTKGKTRIQMSKITFPPFCVWASLFTRPCCIWRIRPTEMQHVSIHNPRYWTPWTQLRAAKVYSATRVGMWQSDIFRCCTFSNCLHFLPLSVILYRRLRAGRSQSI